MGLFSCSLNCAETLIRQGFQANGATSTLADSKRSLTPPPPGSDCHQKQPPHPPDAALTSSPCLLVPLSTRSLPLERVELAEALLLLLLARRLFVQVGLCFLLLLVRGRLCLPGALPNTVDLIRSFCRLFNCRKARVGRPHGLH